ncbi:MAG TPA: asparaginase [Spirochaetia bacterium]|nr:asparaginase [Spirochaetia bacterium]
MSEVLLNVMRGGMVESRHRGDLAVIDVDGKVVFSLGDPHFKTFWRSAAKPFQALTLVEEGGIERFALSGRELAVIVSSHGGEEEHTQTVASVLAKTGCTESDLACGPAAPLHPPAAERLMRRNLPFLPLHNPCSGKHSGMLALCKLKGWPVEGYQRPGHPLQRNTLAVIAEMTATGVSEITIGVDGCGVPVFGLPISGMAQAYARLARPGAPAGQTRSTALQIIRQAIVEHPFFVAGTGRLDTALMEVTAGRVVAKFGAEGVYCAGLAGRGLAMCLKIEDGGTRALAPVIIEVMTHLGWLTDEELVKLEAWRRPLTRNHRGEIVGSLEVAYRF